MRRYLPALGLLLLGLTTVHLVILPYLRSNGVGTDVVAIINMALSIAIGVAVGLAAARSS